MTSFVPAVETIAVPTTLMDRLRRLAVALGEGRTTPNSLVRQALSEYLDRAADGARASDGASGSPRLDTGAFGLLPGDAFVADVDVEGPPEAPVVKLSRPRPREPVRETYDLGAEGPFGPDSPTYPADPDAVEASPSVRIGHLAAALRNLRSEVVELAARLDERDSSTRERVEQVAAGIERVDERAAALEERGQKTYAEVDGRFRSMTALRLAAEGRISDVEEKLATEVRLRSERIVSEARRIDALEDWRAAVEKLVDEGVEAVPRVHPGWAAETTDAISRLRSSVDRIESASRDHGALIDALRKRTDERIEEIGDGWMSMLGAIGANTGLFKVVRTGSDTSPRSWMIEFSQRSDR